MTKSGQIKSNRPATLVAQTRIDARTLATLASFWTLKGEHIGSISNLVRLSVELLREIIVAKHSETDVDSTAMAAAILEKMGLKDLYNSRRKNAQTFAKQLQIEDTLLDNLAATKSSIMLSNPAETSKTSTIRAEFMKLENEAKERKKEDAKDKAILSSSKGIETAD